MKTLENLKGKEVKNALAVKGGTVIGSGILRRCHYQENVSK